MTTPKKTSRADAVRQRRSSKKRVQERSKPVSNTQRTDTRKTSRTSQQAYRPESIFLPVKPRPVAPSTLRQRKSGTLRQVQGITLRQAFGVSSPANTQRSGTKAKGNSFHRTLREHQGKMTKDPHRKGYDFAFSLGRTAVHAPLLSLPNLGSRWVSAGLSLLLGLLLYTMLTANTFKVSAIEVTGNQRLASDEVSAKLSLTGQSIFITVPSQIEKDLRTAFPDLAGVSVQVGFPNHVRVAVLERTPILAWYQEGNTTWIDTNGMAFTPRGDVPGLVQIASSGPSPTPNADPEKSIYDHPFISPAMVQAILALYSQVPEGAPMIYDSKYGIGWQDPRGWSVYFGQNTQEIDMKKTIYQAILNTFSQQGVQPTLISVAYLDAPFYK